jgi:collagenase-like PrtC family protease
MANSPELLSPSGHLKNMEHAFAYGADAVNQATLKFWQQLGLTRLILSRKLSLDNRSVIKRTKETYKRTSHW